MLLISNSIVSQASWRKCTIYLLTRRSDTEPQLAFISIDPPPSTASFDDTYAIKAGHMMCSAARPGFWLIVSNSPCADHIAPLLTTYHYCTEFRVDQGSPYYNQKDWHYGPNHCRQCYWFDSQVSASIFSLHPSLSNNSRLLSDNLPLLCRHRLRSSGPVVRQISLLVSKW